VVAVVVAELVVTRALVEYPEPLLLLLALALLLLPLPLLPLEVMWKWKPHWKTVGSLSREIWIP
jgi:hypothetical protein